MFMYDRSVAISGAYGDLLTTHLSSGAILEWDVWFQTRKEAGTTRDDVNVHTQKRYVTQRGVTWRVVTRRTKYFYTILKRLFCTGIFTETRKACSKTLKNVNVILPDPNSKLSLEETILGFSPAPVRIRGIHNHPTHSMHFPH